MTIAIGADHAGYQLKEELIEELRATKHEVQDLGCDAETRVDYPDIAQRVGTNVAQGQAERGVLICGSGQGMTIAANKVAGVRAVFPSNKLSAFLTREHNDANVICFGAWTTEPAEAMEVLKVWLFSAFAGGVHQKRVEKIHRIEQDH